MLCAARIPGHEFVSVKEWVPKHVAFVGMLVPRAWSICGQRNDVSSAGHSHHTAIEELSSRFNVYIQFARISIENIVRR